MAGGIQKAIVKRMAAQFGIDADASVPEILQSANEAFGLGLSVETPEAVADVEAAVIALAVEAKAATGREGAKFFLMSAAPEGKPPLKALIILG